MPKSVKYIGTQSRWPELAATGKQSSWFPGQIEERGDTEVAQLLATGLFSDVDAINQTDAETAAIASLVSADGNQPSATLAATVGTPGQVVKLSDGADKGVSLVWAIPSGASAYAWCWQIYPQAAY